MNAISLWNINMSKNRKNFHPLSVNGELFKNVLEFQKLNDMRTELLFKALSTQILFEGSAS